MLTAPTGFVATILVADAAPVFRRGLAQLLSQAFPDYCVQEAASGTELLALTAALVPALVITAASLPEAPAAPDALLASLREARAQVPVVVLTDAASTPEPALLRLLRQDVNALLTRTAPLEEVCETIRLVLQRGRCYNDYVITLLQRQLGHRNKHRTEAVFTERQLEILRLMADDLSNEEIADYMCTSVRTVEYHRSQMLHRAGTRTTLGLVLFALRHGLLAGFAGVAPVAASAAG